MSTAEQYQISNAVEPAATGRTRILVVDDDERNLIVLTEVLHDIAEVVAVQSGEEALRQLLREQFAVIVLDVLMPGIDGYETAKLIRGRPQSRDTPIIFLTAVNKEDSHMLRGYDIGAADYVFKPFEPAIVRSKVSVFVSLREKTLEIERKAASEQRLLEEKLRAERERNGALEHLRIAEERQELVLRALPIAVYSKATGDSPPLFVAGNISALTGFPASTFKSDLQLWHQRIHPEDRGAVEAEQPASRTLEYRWQHADGGYRHYWDQSIRMEDGAIAGILRDVTERRSMQDQLVQAQKMEALGKLTGGIAHDFNNLLASILSGLSLIERRGNLDLRAAELLSMTRHSAEHGRHLVTRLLSFSRRQTLVPQVVNLAGLPASLGGMLEPVLGGMVKLDWQLGDELWRTYVDLPQLELVMMNLVLNARDAMPEGGTVTIRIDNAASAGVDDLPDGDYLRLVVADTGVGIPEHLISKVIEPFFTTKDVGKGTGLGLSMAYGFAEQSGGKLQLQSRVGHGTEVLLWLPKSEARPATIDPGRALDDATMRSRKNRILLVDDSPTLRAMTEMLLHEDGYAVTAASGGPDALVLIERDPQAFDAIITDLAMPAMSGIELIRRARELRPDYPAVIITGNAEGLPAADRPADVELVLKPFPAKVLDRAVQDALSHDQPARP